MITGINESKTLTKHTSCQCKCKFENIIQIKSGVTIVKHNICEKDYIWNPAIRSCEYLANI